MSGTGQGFCYNAGRAIGSFFPTMVGFVSEGMPLGAVIAVFSAVAFGLMIVMLLMLPETRGRNLAELSALRLEDRQLFQAACDVELGQRVLDYAKTNPSDPDLPEALALTVRATRYACLVWGASKPDNQQAASTENSAMLSALKPMRC